MNNSSKSSIKRCRNYLLLFTHLFRIALQRKQDVHFVGLEENSISLGRPGNNGYCTYTIAKSPNKTVETENDVTILRMLNAIDKWKLVKTLK